jgi:phenylalanyl-tRNA synthetase beta chain
LGLEISEGEASSILERLGFATTKATSGRLTVQIPSFRPDIDREIDLIEEVARVHGFDKISDRSRLSQAVSQKRPEALVAEKARLLLLGAGFYEVMTISFESAEVLEAFGALNEALAISNAIDKERPLLRPTLLSGLLRVKKTNEDQGVARLKIFELAHTYRAQGAKGKLPIEKMHLALLEDGEQDGNFFALKGVLENIFEAIDLLEDIEIIPAAVPFLSPTHSAKILVGDQAVGILGIISENLRSLFDLSSRPVVAELDFACLAEKARLGKRYRPLPRFPGVRRDLALVVDEEISWAALKAAIEEVQPAFLEEISFFDEYRSPEIGEGKKSIAFSLLFRSPEKTLTNEEVDRAEESIIKHLRTKGYRLRSQ